MMTIYHSTWIHSTKRSLKTFKYLYDKPLFTRQSSKKCIYIPTVDLNQSTMVLLQRWKKYSIADLNSENNVVSFIHDTTVGWDLDSINHFQAIYLLKSIIRTLMFHHIRIPSVTWASWLHLLEYTIHQEPNLDILRKEKPTLKMWAVLHLLNDIDPKSWPDSPIDNHTNLFSFLLDYIVTPTDLNILTDQYLLLNPKNRSSLVWAKLLVRLIELKACSLERIMELCHITISIDQLAMPHVFYKVLLEFILFNSSSKSRKMFLNRFPNLDSIAPHQYNNVIIAGFTESQQFTFAAQLLANLIKNNRHLDISSHLLVLLLKKMFDNRLASDALHFISKTTDLKLSIPQKSITDFPESQQKIQMNQQLFECIIYGLISSKMLGQAFELFHQTSFTRTPTLYAIMMKGVISVKTPNISLLRDLKRKMDRDGISMTLDHLTLFFTAYCKLNDTENASRILQQVVKENHKFDLPLCTSMVKYGFTIGGIKNNADILNLLVQSDIHPDQQFFSVLTDRMVSDGNLHDLDHIYDICKVYIKPNKYIFTNLLKGKLLLRKFDEAETVLSNMQLYNIPYDTVIITMLMNYWLSERNFLKATQCFGDMIGYDFEKSTRIDVPSHQKADLGAIWTYMDALMSANMGTLLSLTLYRLLQCGFTIPKRKMVILLDFLGEYGLVWPIILLPQLEKPPEQASLFKSFQIRIEENYNYLSTSSPLIASKLDDILQFIHLQVSHVDSIPYNTRLQWECVDLLFDSRKLIAEFGYEFLQPIEKLLEIIILHLVLYQLSHIPTLNLSMPALIKNVFEFFRKHSTSPHAIQPGNCTSVKRTSVINSNSLQFINDYNRQSVEELTRPVENVSIVEEPRRKAGIAGLLRNTFWDTPESEKYTHPFSRAVSTPEKNIKPLNQRDHQKWPQLLPSHPRCFLY
ncbi:hypothetical protein BC833DRAFT_592405 [Globomyces pollinis-pini]|nr:hypothetical protein BC833DRAFT_592405 [Globomyces pollinis-pini]